jgi:hypothetical protein
MDMPDDLSRVEASFEQRLRAMQQQRREMSPREIPRGERIAFLSPVCSLLDAMYSSDIRFPIGKSPSCQQCRDQLYASVGGPAIHFNIDVRRSVRLSCRALGDPAELHYTASLLDCNIPHGQELVTTRIEDVSAWLLENVVPLAFTQPTRPTTVHKLLGGPPGMLTDDSWPDEPPPPPAANPLPQRESRRVDLG